MQYSCFCSRESSNRVIAGSFLRPGCLPIAKVVSKSSAPRASIALPAHGLASAQGPGTAWGATPLPSTGAPLERCHLPQGTFGAVPPAPGPAGSCLQHAAEVCREVWPGCTQVGSDAARPSSGPRAFAVSLHHVALKAW